MMSHEDHEVTTTEGAQLNRHETLLLNRRHGNRYERITKGIDRHLCGMMSRAEVCGGNKSIHRADEINLKQ